MGFADLQAASRTRDALERMISSVIRRERPEPFLAKIYDVDLNNQKCRVLPVGQSSENLLTVRFALDKIPRNAMADRLDLGDEAPADIVRVWGYSGSYFILDYFAGSPYVPGENVGVALHGDPSFEIQPWINGFPNGWTNFWNNGTNTYFQEGNDVLHGRYALKIVRGDGATTRIHNSTVFAVTPGEQITVSSWAKASGLTGVLKTMLLSAPTAAGADFFGTGLVQQAVDQAMDVQWKKHETTFTVPATHTYARVSFLVSNSVAADMTFFIDDTFSLRPAIVPFINFDGTDYTGQPVLFNANWANYGLGHTKGGYRKVDDVVEIRGLVTPSAGAGANCVTLPTGYRPTGKELFTCVANSGTATMRVDVEVGGNIHFDQAVTTGGFYSLAGIHFSVI